MMRLDVESTLMRFSADAGGEVSMANLIKKTKGINFSRTEDTNHFKRL